jgi:hypothetical protein
MASKLAGKTEGNLESWNFLKKSVFKIILF